MLASSSYQHLRIDPTYGDLPYINALVKEVLRWNNVTPLGEIIDSIDLTK